MSLPSHQQQSIRRLLKCAEALELSHASVQRLKWFLFAAEHDGNVSLTCRHFGISRSTFLRWRHRFDPRDTDTLKDESRRPHTVRTPETGMHTIAVLEQIRRAQPKIGKNALQHLLAENCGIHLSTSTIGRIITRHRLFFADTPSHQAKREFDDEPETSVMILPSHSIDDEVGVPFLPEAGFAS